MTRSRIAGPAAWNRRGVTLVELLVVLVILGLVASIAVFAPSAVERPPADETEAEIARVRREALRSGHAVTIDLTVNDQPHAVTALPDGSVVADPVLAMDRLSGRRVVARGAETMP